MSKSKTRHVRKHRRLDSARLRTGKRIVRHRCLSGRTGTAHSKKLQTLEDVKNEKSQTLEELEYE